MTAGYSPRTAAERRSRTSVIAPPPPDRLLRAGLRIFVVALVRPRPHTRLHRRFRAVSGGARRAGPHPWQGRHPRAVEGDGALARVGLVWYRAALLLPVAIALGATVLNVLLGAPAPTSAELGAWPSLPHHLLPLALDPRHRRRLGGAGVAWIRPSPSLQAGRSALSASLILGVGWAFWHLPLMVYGTVPWSDSVRHRRVGGVLVVVQQHRWERAARDAVPHHEQRHLGYFFPPCSPGPGWK